MDEKAKDNKGTVVVVSDGTRRYIGTVRRQVVTSQLHSEFTLDGVFEVMTFTQPVAAGKGQQMQRLVALTPIDDYKTTLDGFVIKASNWYFPGEQRDGEFAKRYEESVLQARAAEADIVIPGSGSNVRQH